MILAYQGIWPDVHETAFVASSADVIGHVHVGALSSIWFQCVVRGDVHKIHIGQRTNIQDQSVLHVTRDEWALTVGNGVTVGHRVLLHGCTIHDSVLVGMGSIIMDGAVIAENSIVGAGSLVTEGKIFPPRSLIYGSPARLIRALDDKECTRIRQSAIHYVADAKKYYGFVPGAKRHNDDQYEFSDDQDSE